MKQLSDGTSIPIFDKVLFVGPDLKEIGGISSVLISYSTFVKPFHYAQVNSSHGTLVGLFVLAKTMLYIPFARLLGRKIIHIHFCSGKSWQRESRISAWARLWGLKVVMHCHSGRFPDYAKKHIGSVRSTLSRSDVNVVLSPKWSKIFETELKIVGTRPINNVIYPSKATHAAPDINQPTRFTFIGDIIDRKGIFDLIDATDLLDDGNWEVVICGRGDNEQLEKRISESPHKNKIEFRGVITPSERDNLLAQTDAVVLPSYFEGVPIVVLEGMSAGAGVIATDVGAVSDLVSDGKNGFLVTPGDKEGLAQAMKRYIENRNLVAEHAAVSAERVKSFYPEAIRRSLLDLYTDILN